MTNDVRIKIIEKFKQEVFRKPYVSSTGESEQLDLRHIYTPGKYVQQVRYTTREIDEVICFFKVLIFSKTFLFIY